MLSAKELQRIIDSFSVAPDAPATIPIEDGDYMERISTGRYLLHRPDGEFHVKGLAWGFGTLFVYTEERGTTGIRYAHEPIHTEPADDETEEEYCPQRTLDAWLGGTA